MKIIHQLSDKFSIDASCTMYPTRITVVMDRMTSLELDTPSTIYGYVFNGSTELQGSYGKFELLAGGYFSLPINTDLGSSRLNVQGTVLLIQRFGFRGQIAFGVIEEKGRLTYIDGCSDTLLVYPPRMGDPCLNHLHFPAGVVQSVHCHPTIRTGIVARGRGTAYSPAYKTEDDWKCELQEGAIFLIDAQEPHAFRTDISNESMDIIAFHPDSDWGPTDRIHPMLNRTYFKDG